jgi:hypothetical protein
MRMPHEPPKEMTVQDSVNLTYFACTCLATVTTPFIRIGFGREALGFPGLGAVAIMILWGGLNASPMTLRYLALWLVALAIQRTVSISHWMRGIPVHSRFAGHSWLVGGICKWEKVTRLVLEPALVIGVGYFVAGLLSPKLGMLLMASGAGLWMVHCLEYWAEAVRVGSLTDARFEMERMAALYRRRR